MEKYKIKIYPKAQKDLKNIVEYLNTLSQQAALRYYDLLIESIASLKAMPLRCPYAKDPQLKLKGYRSLLVENYIVFYCINKDTVQIRRILYAKMQYEYFL